MRLDSMSYMSDVLEVRAFPQKGAFGTFARQPIPSGSLLMFWGGRILPWEQFQALSEEWRVHSAQVEENLFIVPLSLEDETNFINHSCNPNAGFSSPVSVVAMRDIMVGEEVCFDYAMCDSLPYDPFICACGDAACRGQVSGDDWQMPALQARYRGYFSPYLERRIQGGRRT